MRSGDLFSPPGFLPFWVALSWQSPRKGHSFYLTAFFTELPSQGASSPCLFRPGSCQLPTVVNLQYYIMLCWFP